MIESNQLWTLKAVMLSCATFIYHSCLLGMIVTIQPEKLTFKLQPYTLICLTLESVVSVVKDFINCCFGQSIGCL